MKIGNVDLWTIACLSVLLGGTIPILTGWLPSRRMGWIEWWLLASVMALAVTLVDCLGVIRSSEAKDVREFCLRVGNNLKPSCALLFGIFGFFTLRVVVLYGFAKSYKLLFLVSSSSLGASLILGAIILILAILGKGQRRKRKRKVPTRERSRPPLHGTVSVRPLPI